MVADAARLVDRHRQDVGRTKTEKYQERRGTIEFLKMQQNGLMERKKRMLKGAS